MRWAIGSIPWVLFGVVGLIIILFGCAAEPVMPDPYSPWTNIPKPIDCSGRTGHPCQEWREPGMMVHP